MTRTRAIAYILSVGLLMAPAVAAGRAGASGAAAPPAALSEEMVVRMGANIEALRVATPDAATSLAAPVEESPSDPAQFPADMTYTLTSTVVVEARGLSANDVSALVGGVVAPVDGAPGFWTVSAGTVRSALDLADALSQTPGIRSATVSMVTPRTLRNPDDPSFAQQWHLVNLLRNDADVNADAAWNLGLTGAGVTIGIVEGGFQSNHPDLAANYSAAASMSGGFDTSHGTSCAGVAAAVAFNGAGGAGAAYGANISQQIYGDAVGNATAFGYRNDLNDIKSNSWGPTDNARYAFIAPVELSALQTAVQSGRGGLGEIFVWAAGNGGAGADRVDYDPYASSRYTIAIGSIGDQDTRAWYNERGASMLAVASSSGNSRFIYTTTSGSAYTSSFGGTSSASPLAAGVIGLILEANPNLTWRDVQHILVQTARKNDPTQADWTLNGAGLHINHNYGFGAVDAGAACAAALNWQNAGPEVVYDSGEISVNAALPDNDPNGVTMTLDVPENLRVESVELIFTGATTSRGDLAIRLVSPMGTTSIFAEPHYDPGDNLTNYVFTSLRNWDEESAGTWTIKVADGQSGEASSWTSYALRIYGTAIAADCPGDLNNDGEVSLADLAVMFANWGNSGPGDIDGSGTVDVADLGILFGAWGMCE